MESEATFTKAMSPLSPFVDAQNGARRALCAYSSSSSPGGRLCLGFFRAVGGGIGREGFREDGSGAGVFHLPGDVRGHSRARSNFFYQVFIADFETVVG